MKTCIYEVMNIHFSSYAMLTIFYCVEIESKNPYQSLSSKSQTNGKVMGPLNIVNNGGHMESKRLRTTVLKKKRKKRLKNKHENNTLCSPLASF